MHEFPIRYKYLLPLQEAEDQLPSMSSSNRRAWQESEIYIRLHTDSQKKTTKRNH